MSKDKKPDMFDLFNDDSLWGNQETDALSHDDIMNKNWNNITANRRNAEKKLAKVKSDPIYAKQYKAEYKKRGKEWAEKFKNTEYKKQYSINVSKNKPTNVTPKEAFEIYYACLEPKEEVRSAKYMTKLGKKYNLNLDQVRKIAYGDHYAFGGERITEKNIRINHTEIDPKADFEHWKKTVIGVFKFTSPAGEVYEFDDYVDCGLWMQSLDKTSGDPYLKCYKKFHNKPLNTPVLLKQRFWKSWTMERIKNED
jgi:hypothetical protein